VVEGGNVLHHVKREEEIVQGICPGEICPDPPLYGTGRR